MQPLVDGLTTVFNFVIEKVVDPLLTVGEKIAKPITDAFSTIGKTFESLFSGLKKIFSFDFGNAAKQLKEAFTRRFIRCFCTFKNYYEFVYRFA